MSSSKEEQKIQNTKLDTIKKQFSYEVDSLGSIKSDYVIQKIKAYKTSSRQYLITELCNGGDLQ
jgi:serine/threonine protein kinase